MKLSFFGILMSFFLSEVQALPLQGLTHLDRKAASVSHEKNKELVVFWATWCSDCKEKLKSFLPELNRSSDVAVVTVNLDRSVDRAIHFVKEEQISLPVLRDEEKALRKPLGVFSVPHWVVYERKDADSEWKRVDSAPAFEMDRIYKALGKNG